MSSIAEKLGSACVAVRGNDLPGPPCTAKYVGRPGHDETPTSGRLKLKLCNNSCRTYLLHLLIGLFKENANVYYQKFL